jgi:molybdopterin-guanine dinucleotide biosynthesis protein A
MERRVREADAGTGTASGAGVLAGLFVGGAGARLGGVAKGNLAAPGGETLVQRSTRLLEGLGLTVVLVGRHAGYQDRLHAVVEDDPPGIGPLGGLVGLLRHAGHARVLALACDMPFVSAALVRELLAFAPAAAIVAPRREGKWEPLCAVYAARVVLPLAAARVARGARSLQGLLDEVGATELPLEESRYSELADWDTPDDLVSGH